MTLQFKTKSGQICELVVEELLSVDGKPFEQRDDLRELVYQLHGRIEAIENIFTMREEIPLEHSETTVGLVAAGI
jgi:hypothetical protein